MDTKKRFLLISLIIIFILILIVIGYKTFSISELQKSRMVDDIVEPVFTQDCFPRTLQQSGVSKNCFERANLGQNLFCSKKELKIIEEYYQKGQENDPLNDGSGQFCAD